MKKAFTFSIFSITFFCFAAISNATLMEATITGLVAVASGNTSSIWNPGDGFELSVLYDNEGTAVHAWNDGLNGIAELGGGDDTLYDMQTTTDRPEFSYLDDAQFNFDTKTNTYRGLITDTTPRNWSYAAYRTVLQELNLYFVADGFHTDVYIPDIGTPDVFVYSEGSQFNRLVLSDITLDTHTLEPVPEPATMLLLGTGLVGVAGAARRRKKKNQA